MHVVSWPEGAAASVVPLVTGITEQHCGCWLQSFGGVTKQFKHISESLGCEMKFSIFFPPACLKAPILYFLSGLTCTDRNFIEKVRVGRSLSLSVVPVWPCFHHRQLGELSAQVRAALQSD